MSATLRFRGIIAVCGIGGGSEFSVSLRSAPVRREYLRPGKPEQAFGRP